jgi:hypothetical protein
MTATEEARVAEDTGHGADIIRSRFRAMAEGRISQEEISQLSEAQINAFLTISDPDQWPTAIAHLKKYVTDETVA